MHTVQIIWIARRCLIYAESELSAPNRPCSFSYHLTQPLAQFLHVFFELSPKCDDNSHEQHIKTKTATCSKMSASPSRLNFFYLIFSWFLYNVFDKKSWQCYTVAQFRLSWAMPTPTPVTQLAFCFPDSENKGELWGTEAGFSQSGWVCMTLWWLQGAFLDQRSRWLSLNITVFLPTNGISRLCYGAMRNKGWLYEIQRREGGRIERPH